MAHKPRRQYVIGALVATLIPAQASAISCGTALNPLSVSATGVSFGAYDPLTPSSGSANRFSPRAMTSGASVPSYDLYTAAARTSIWGDGTSDTETRSYDGLLVLGHVELAIHGAIPQGQFVSAGAYTDTIIVTIEY